MVFLYLQQTDIINPVNIGPFFPFFLFSFFKKNKEKEKEKTLICFPGRADLFSMDCFAFVFNVSLNVIVKACML